MTQADLGDAPQKEALTLESQAGAEDTELENEDDLDEKTGEDDEQTGSETSDAEADEGAEADPEAARKEAQERLIEQEKELQPVRAAIKEDWDDIEAAHEQIKKGIHNPIPLNGKPAYLATDEEFEAAEDAILESGDKGLLAALKQARQERREYLKKAQALAPKFQKVQQERTKRTLEDVSKIKDALKEINPEYEKHFSDIETLLQEEFEANPAKLERFVWGGIQDKYRMIDRLLESSGIKGRVEKDLNAKTRPNLAAPVGAGKGKRGTPTGTQKRIYTRQEVRELTKKGLSDQLEKELDKAMTEGRIK